MANAEFDLFVQNLLEAAGGPWNFHETYGISIGVLRHEDDFQTIFNDPEIQPWIENRDLAELEAKYNLEMFLWEEAGVPTPWMLIGILPPPPPQQQDHHPQTDESIITQSSSGGEDSN